MYTFLAWNKREKDFDEVPAEYCRDCYRSYYGTKCKSCGADHSNDWEMRMFLRGFGGSKRPIAVFPVEAKNWARVNSWESGLTMMKRILASYRVKKCKA